MIERLLTAERAVEDGDLPLAERLYRQVADADPRNAIAIVGLARVAQARGERDEARRLVDRALEIDPDEAVARRLRDDLTAASEPAAAAAWSPPRPAPEPGRASQQGSPPASEPPAGSPPASAPPAGSSPAPAPPAMSPSVSPSPATMSPSASASPPSQQPASSATDHPPDATPVRRSGVLAWLRRLLRLDR